MAFKRLKQSGVSLIETLIAFAVISIVVMAVVRVSVANLTVESKTLNHTIAVMRAKALFNRLHVNWKSPALQRTVILWNANNAAMLPLGHGNISCNAMLQTCTVRITWQSSAKQSYAATEHMPHIIHLTTHSSLGVRLES